MSMNAVGHDSGCSSHAYRLRVSLCADVLSVKGDAFPERGQLGGPSASEVPGLRVARSTSLKVCCTLYPRWNAAESARGVNEAEENLSSLHTRSGCTLSKVNSTLRMAGFVCWHTQQCSWLMQSIGPLGRPTAMHAPMAIKGAACRMPRRLPSVDHSMMLVEVGSQWSGMLSTPSRCGSGAGQ